MERKQTSHIFNLYHTRLLNGQSNSLDIYCIRGKCLQAIFKKSSGEKERCFIFRFHKYLMVNLQKKKEIAKVKCFLFHYIECVYIAQALPLNISIYILCISNNKND